MDESAKTYISPPGAATSQQSINKAGANTTMAAQEQMSSNASIKEPAIPPSAYGMFFQDIVRAVKKDNPSCTFQELLRIASSMWEAMDDKQRDAYDEKYAAARTEYVRQYKLYEQQQKEQQSQTLNEDNKHRKISNTHNKHGKISNTHNKHRKITNTHNKHRKITNTVTPQSKPAVSTIKVASTQEQSQQKMIKAKKHSKIPSMSTLQSKPAAITIKQATTQQQQQPIKKTNIREQPPASTVKLNNPSQASNPPTSTEITLFQENVLSVASAGLKDTKAVPTDTNALPTATGAAQICIYNGCNKPTVSSPDWENEYCSNECAVKHCVEIFGGWVLTNKAGKQY